MRGELGSLEKSMPGAGASKSKAPRLQCIALVPVKRKREYFLYSYICQRVEREEDCWSIGHVSQEKGESMFFLHHHFHDPSGP